LGKRKLKRDEWPDCAVPELTRSGCIQLNERVSLRPSGSAVSISAPDIAPHPDLAYRSRRAIIFRSAALFKRVNMSDGAAAFQVICVKCGALGIVLDYSEGAPLSTPIKCRGCGDLRGTLGDLRTLARLHQHDTFDLSYE
jgi:hypothetical protein